MTSRARVIIVGSGSREHALATAIVAGGHRVSVAPGNAGTQRVGENLPLRSDDIGGLVDRAVADRVDLVVIGPEMPLALGLVDALIRRGVRAFGPSRAASRLESSKAFMKRFCERHGIPTASFAVFDDADAADRHARAARRPLVVKADGLAAGKGVVVADTIDESSSAIDRMMRKGQFGEAGRTVVLEERLAGRGGELPRGMRRYPRCGSRARAGPQEGGRRRHGAQYGRYGCLRARARSSTPWCTIG